MLPATKMPFIQSGGENNEILNPSTMIYLRQLTQFNPFNSLPYPLSVLRFIEIMRGIDLREAKIMHATESSRAALHLINMVDEVNADSTLIFSDLPFLESARLTRVQRVGGTLIAVIGDMVNRCDIQLLYLLCACYKTVRIQSLTVSHADPERMLICSDFVQAPEFVDPPFDFEMSLYFLSKLDEINSMNGQVRLELVRSTPRDKTVAWMTAHL